MGVYRHYGAAMQLDKYLKIKNVKQNRGSFQDLIGEKQLYQKVIKNITRCFLKKYNFMVQMYLNIKNVISAFILNGDIYEIINLGYKKKEKNH